MFLQYISLQRFGECFFKIIFIWFTWQWELTTHPLIHLINNKLLDKCCFLGEGIERVKETDIVLIWMVVSTSSGEFLYTFIMNRNDPKSCPDLYKALGSIASLPPSPHGPPLCCTGFGNKKCSGLHRRPGCQPLFRCG